MNDSLLLIIEIDVSDVADTKSQACFVLLEIALM